MDTCMWCGDDTVLEDHDMCLECLESMTEEPSSA